VAERSRKVIFHLVNTSAEIENAIEKLPTEFEWRGKACFSSGAFACRRNAISFELWDRTESWAGSRRACLLGKMGILNYLVYATTQRDELKVQW
jgi:hypothetical protein